MGSWSWPFGVTWRHRSLDHLTRGGRLPMGGPWWLCVYLARLWKYGAARHVHRQTHTTTDRLTNLIISSNVHSVHLAEIMMIAMQLMLSWLVCRVVWAQMQQGAELSDDEQLVLERWLDEAKFSRVLKPSTHREAIQRVLCHYVFDSRMSQLQAIAVSAPFDYSHYYNKFFLSFRGYSRRKSREEGKRIFFCLYIIHVMSCDITQQLIKTS